MRTLLSLFAVVALLAVAAAFGAMLASGSDEPTAHASLEGVRVGDNFFSRPRVNASRGETVRWIWVGENRHNITSLSGTRLRSSTMRSGTYSRRIFRDTRYICTIHPNSMRGRINVPG
jgi:plastocyanin